ncbi:MAG: helix-turn-helix domain-containing protein [Actinomycetota bacterium]|nr:helix-turn-helix domain-containing protein [Actinomycetota bacterium]
MSGKAGNPHTGIEIGRSLRLAREKRGLSFQQVEEATKIRTRYLRDLENENFDVLPAVYMLGSLKTYAEHLGLDGAAIARELKRRQASLQPEQDQAPEDSPSDEPRGFLASLGRLAGIGGTVEDEAGAMAPVRRPGLYVSLVVVLLFVLATYLASSIRSEDLPPVSPVREPTVSQLPSGIVLVGNVEDAERNPEDLSEEKQAEPPSKDGETQAEQSGQEEHAPRSAHAPSSSAIASASASAASASSASPAYTGSASAPATVAPGPTKVRPEPAAGEQRGGESMVAPADPPARVSRSQSLHETQAGPVGATRPGDGIPNKAKEAVDSVCGPCFAGE